VSNDIRDLLSRMADRAAPDALADVLVIGSGPAAPPAPEPGERQRHVSQPYKLPEPGNATTAASVLLGCSAFPLWWLHKSPRGTERPLPLLATKTMSECLPDLPRYVRQRDDKWQGADHPDGPWRPIPAPQSGLPWPVPSAAQTAALSPAAQAVKDAALAMYGDCNIRRLAWPLDMPVVAATLRAVAGQVVPKQPSVPEGDLTEQTYRWDERSGIRAEILAIAAELEGFNA
jgi:hypothetical protein